MESAHKNDTCAYGKIKNQIDGTAPYTLQKQPGSFEKRTKYCWNRPSTSCQKQLAGCFKKGSLSLEGPLHFTKEARVLENKILELGRTLHLLTAARVLAKRIRELGRTLQFTKEARVVGKHYIINAIITLMEN
jgi:hypothetical protein